MRLNVTKFTGFLKCNFYGHFPKNFKKKKKKKGRNCHEFADNALNLNLHILLMNWQSLNPMVFISWP